MSQELQKQNGQNKLTFWANRITECRTSGQTVKAWCEENGVCEQTYYKWQKRLFELARQEQNVSFAEVTPIQPVHTEKVAVTVRFGEVEADIRNGANVETVEVVLRVLKSC